MNERPVPWWRKALNYALGEIRSGFGLFPRTAKPASVDPSPAEEERFLDSPEPILEVEKALTDRHSNPEAIPAVAETVIESVTATAAEQVVAHSSPSATVDEVVPQPLSAPEPTQQLQPTPELIVTALPASEFDPAAPVESQSVDEPGDLIEPESAAEIAEVIEPISEPEPQPEYVVQSDEMPEPIAEPEIAIEPPPAAESAIHSDSVSEADLISEPFEQPAEVIVQLSSIPEESAESENEPEVEPLPEQAVSPVAETAPATRVVPEALPAPSIELKSAMAPEPPPAQVEAPDPVSDEKAAAKVLARQKKLDEASEDSPFSVLVDHVYDGPLDLLLDLIRKQDIDIYDIPIAKITAQFLAYVSQLKATDVDVAGEFIYTASLLIHIKSKMLLPRSPLGPDDTAEDPRRELVDRLLEHERFKNAAQMLQQKQLLEAATWTNPGFREFQDDTGTEPEIAADTVDLVRIFRDILERARNRPVLDVEEDAVTVSQMIQFLARRLTMEDKPIALRRLLSHTRSERALVAMFLALLELVRLQAVLLRQDRAFSDIFIKKHTGFDTVINQGLANSLDDWR
jgi:segregation and condensation protein A